MTSTLLMDLILLLQYRRHDIKTTSVFVPSIFSPSEKKKLVAYLQEVTSMNLMFSLRFLEDVDWDVRCAIKNFMKLYKLNKIPPEAFE